MSDGIPLEGRRLPDDWYDGFVPSNVVFDESNHIDTSYSFRRFRSRAARAMTLGRGAAIYVNSMFDLGPDARVSIGDYAMLNGVSIICDTSVTIGAYGLISWNVLLIDNLRAPRIVKERRAYLDALLRGGGGPGARDLGDSPRPILIGENVWIGHDAVVVPGVSIGKGSIVGARTVVTESIPDFSIVAGNPARITRRLEPS
jgi:acetyltransferase-like isoleucine patch superfamily enzyme